MPPLDLLVPRDNVPGGEDPYLAQLCPPALETEA